MLLLNDFLQIHDLLRMLDKIINSIQYIEKLQIFSEYRLQMESENFFNTSLIFILVILLLVKKILHSQELIPIHLRRMVFQKHWKITRSNLKITSISLSIHIKYSERLKIEKCLLRNHSHQRLLINLSRPYLVLQKNIFNEFQMLQQKNQHINPWLCNFICLLQMHSVNLYIKLTQLIRMGIFILIQNTLNEM